jgi:hypothetical protein
MIVDVATFESCVRALDDPRHAAAASAALEELRRSASALPLARAVVDDASSSAAAAFHAVLTVRAVVVSAWGALAPAERAGARAWLLATAKARGHAGAPGALATPVVTALCVAAAVLWKRGWLEEVGAGECGRAGAARRA